MVRGAAGTWALGLAVLVGGCFYGDENADRWATPDQIRAAAGRCGIADFQPMRTGDGWAAYVDKNTADRQTKEDCIYADLARQGRLTTR